MYNVKIQYLLVYELIFIKQLIIGFCLFIKWAWDDKN